MSASVLATMIVSSAASVLALVFAAIVLRSDPRGTMSRRLAALLIFDGLFFAFLALGTRFPLADWLDLLLLTILLLTNGAAHLLFAGTLETPLVRRLRGRGAFRAIAAITAALFLLVLVQVVLGVRNGRVPADEDLSVGFSWPLMALSSLFALVASIDAFRRTARGTPAHRRARSFALAFGSRDLLVGVGILGYGLALTMGRQDIVDWMPVVIAAGVVLFVSLLTYGILSTQLFDIDLRVKWGISRGTVVGIILVTVFVGAKIVENYLNRTAGFVAGSAVAGVLLFLVPRLNKVGEKVANTAMPQVQPTATYVTFKKLEVYRSAVESAIETGGITEKERASLDRLRTKLGLAADDARSVEGELLSVST